MYYNPFKKNNTKEISYSNRGITLENEINSTNNFYLINDKAVIYKKPTPINIINVDYKTRRDAVITKALFRVPSTTDYNGIYKGYYIDFEAKETTSTTSFPISNIHAHQIKHMVDVSKHGGIAFIIVSFIKLNKVFILEIDKFISYINDTNKKSISLTYFEEKGYLIKYKFNPRIDYLEVIDKIIGGKYEKEIGKHKNKI